MKKLRTYQEARAWLEYQGISIIQWARDNNLQDHISLVREVLMGRKKCHCGTSHNIAVLLGMKHGVETTKPGKLKTERRSHERRAGVQA